MNFFKYFLIGLTPILITTLGVFAMIYGETEDSPGLMLIGLMLIGLIIIIYASYINIRRF